MRNFPKHWIVAFAGSSLSLGISYYFQYGNVKANGVLTFLGIFLVYNRYLLVEKERPLFVKAAMIVLILISIGLAVQLASNLFAFGMLLVSGTIGLLYSFKINPASLAIRDIPFLKIGVVVSIWTFVCCIFPWLNTPTSSSFSAYLILHFLYIFAIALAFDIRDVVVDDSQRKTIPQVIGIKFSKISVIACMLLFALSFHFLAISPAHTDLFWIALVVPIVALFIQKDITPKVYGILLEMSLLMLGISYFSL
jgi:hypothetical protein